MDRRQLIVDQSIIIRIKLSHLLDVIYGNGVLLSDLCCCAPLANHVKNAQAVYFFFFLFLPAETCTHTVQLGLQMQK